MPDTNTDIHDEKARTSHDRILQLKPANPYTHPTLPWRNIPPPPPCKIKKKKWSERGQDPTYTPPDMQRYDETLRLDTATRISNAPKHPSADGPPTPVPAISPLPYLPYYLAYRQYAHPCAKRGSFNAHVREDSFFSCVYHMIVVCAVEKMPRAPRPR